MTKIEWCNETLNPQGWGCWGPGGTPEEPRRCWYCYVKRLLKWPGTDCELCRQLIPHWHPERLELPLRWRKPRRIFWGSTSDIFHPYTPEWQIQAILAVAKATPIYTHIFLTKNPKRYQEFNPWPSNCWLLTTITNQRDADERIPELLKAQAPVLGISVEPMLGEIDMRGKLVEFFRDGSNYFTAVPGSMPNQLIHWLIIGAMTGPGSKAHQPKPEWVESLIDQARDACIPLFLKDNLKWKEKIQEWPK